jgi:hypothetical protein
MSGEHAHPEIPALDTELARLAAQVAALGAAPPAPVGSGTPGVIEVDSFAGATDDAKLTNAIAYASAQTYKPTMRLSSRRWDFSTTRTVWTGFKISGSGGGASVEQPRSNSPYATFVKIRTGSNRPWLTTPSGGTVYGCYVGNMSLEGTSSSVFADTTGNGLWRTSVFENLGFSAFRHVLGNPTTGAKMWVTGCYFRGWWNINNCYNVGVWIGGSDNTLWTDGCMLDSPPSFAGSTPYHMHVDYLEKTYIGPMYITCEAVPAGIRVSGSSSQTAVIFTALKIEGRNSSTSSYGSVVRVDSGRVTFRDTWFGYGYSAPGSSGRSGEGGVVTVSGAARVLFDACWYARAGDDGVTEATPWIYATGTGTQVRVRNAQVAEDGGAFTQLPLVSAVSSAAADVDNSVRTS